MNEIALLMAALSDAIATATEHARRKGVDDDFRQQLRQCREAYSALSDAFQAHEPRSSEIFADVGPTMKRFIDELATLEQEGRVSVATVRVPIPPNASGSITWRQATGSNAWHFSERCSQWPTGLFAERAGATRPNTGYVCDECIRAWRTTWLGASACQSTDGVCCRGPSGVPMECRP